jgi:hypothetical protein
VRAAHKRRYEAAEEDFMWIWVGLILGLAIHIIGRAQHILSSPKNECMTVKALARRYGAEIAARVGAIVALTNVWEYKANSFDALMHSVGLPAIPLIGGTAFGLGLAGDFLLESLGEKYPILRRALKGNGDEPPPPAA